MSQIKQNNLTLNNFNSYSNVKCRKKHLEIDKLASLRYHMKELRKLSKQICNKKISINYACQQANDKVCGFPNDIWKL